MNNPIIQEVREAREALAAKFDFDLHRILSDAIAQHGALPMLRAPTGSAAVLVRLLNKRRRP